MRTALFHPFAAIVLFAMMLVMSACSTRPDSPRNETPIVDLYPHAKGTSLPSENAPKPYTYYVAANEPGASDANNGLYPSYSGGQDGPWLTIQHAAKSMKPGDTTFVRAGTYFEAGIVFAHSGVQGAPITFNRYAAEEVILDGSKAKYKSSGIQIEKGQGHYVIQGFVIRNMPRSGITTDGDAAEPHHNITIRDCVLHDNGLSGIRLAAVDGFLIEDVEAYNNGYYGLDVIGSENGEFSAANGVVRDSSFHHHMGREGHGLAINQGHNIIVQDSTAYHNTIHGFDISDMPKGGALSHDIAFDRNFSYDNGVSGFSINSDSHHVVYRQNVAWRNGADNWSGHGAASGFLCYEGCWHIEWLNNISVENTDGGFYVQDPPGKYGLPEDHLLIFKNNIAYNNDSENLWAPALAVEPEDTWQVIAMHNNWSVPSGQKMAVYDQGMQYTPEQINRGVFQVGNISVEPKFIHLAQPDFHLQPDSPCIDAGEDVGLPYLGSAPDMGVYEYEPPHHSFMLLQNQ